MSMSHWCASYPNNQPCRRIKTRDRAEKHRSGACNDDARLAINALSSSKLDMLTSYVNEAQKDDSYVHEWLQRNYSSSTATRTGIDIVVEGSKYHHNSGVASHHQHPSTGSRVRATGGRMEILLSPTQDEPAVRCRSRGSSTSSTSLDRSSAKDRQPPMQCAEAASLEACTGTPLRQDEKYLNDPTLRPARSRSPSPDRLGTLHASAHAHGDLETESLGITSPTLGWNAHGPDAGQGYTSPDQQQSHSSIRDSLNEEDLVDSLLESLAAAAVRSFDSKDSGSTDKPNGNPINSMSPTLPHLPDDAAGSLPPMAPMPPPPPPPVALPPPPPPSGVSPEGLLSVDPGMATAVNIARSLACARSLRRSSEPSRYVPVARESKATQVDEKAMSQHNEPRYKDSSTQTCDLIQTCEVNKQNAHSPSENSSKSMDSTTISKRTRTTTEPSPPISTQTPGSSPRASHPPPKALAARSLLGSEGEPLTHLNDMRRSILEAKSQPSTKRPPANAKGTKLSRMIVNSEALTCMGIHHDVHAEYVVVHRILSRQEIIQLAELTIDIREARSRGEKSGERLWSQWSTDRYSIPWYTDHG